MLDWIWVNGALPLLCRNVNFVVGEVQQWCTGGTSNWDGVISGLPKRTLHRINSLMHDAHCHARCGLMMIGEQKKQMAIECIRIKVRKIKREVYGVAKINREVECRVIGRMGEYLRITLESFSNYLYKYSKTDIVQQRMYLGLKGK